MADFIFGDSFRDLSNQATQRRALDDNRFFQTLANNRAVQEQRDRLKQSAINNALNVATLAAQNASSRGTQAYRDATLQNALELEGIRQKGLSGRSRQNVAADMNIAALRFGADRADREQRNASANFNRAVQLVNTGVSGQVAAEVTGLEDKELEQLKALVNGAVSQEEAKNRNNDLFVSDINANLDRLDDFLSKLNDIDLSEDDEVINQSIIKARDETGLIADISGLMNTGETLPTAAAQFGAGVQAETIKRAQTKGLRATLDSTGRRLTPIPTKNFQPFGTSSPAETDIEEQPATESVVPTRGSAGRDFNMRLEGLYGNPRSRPSRPTGREGALRPQRSGLQSVTDEEAFFLEQARRMIASGATQEEAVRRAENMTALRFGRARTHTGSGLGLASPNSF